MREDSASQIQMNVEFISENFVQAKFDKLQAFTKYGMRVAAFNIEGVGPFSNLLEATTAEGGQST